MNQLSPNTRYEMRVSSRNPSGSSPNVYFEATTTYEETSKTNEHEEEDELDIQTLQKNLGNLLRNDNTAFSESDFGEIDELEFEIFGKDNFESEKFEAGSPKDHDKDPFFNVFLTSAEYRRVVAAAHDQLHRQKILAEVATPQGK